jgi:hypothetical protein
MGAKLPNSRPEIRCPAVKARDVMANVCKTKFACPQPLKNQFNRFQFGTAGFDEKVFLEYRRRLNSARQTLCHFTLFRNQSSILNAIPVPGTENAARPCYPRRENATGAALVQQQCPFGRATPAVRCPNR